MLAFEATRFNRCNAPYPAPPALNDGVNAEVRETSRIDLGLDEDGGCSVSEVALLVLLAVPLLIDEECAIV